MSAPEVMFVCARNAVRSPMAEALYNQSRPAGAISCGLAPAGFPDGHMISVMDEIGIDLGSFECQGLDSVTTHPSRLICLTDEVSQVAGEIASGWGVPVETWDIPDPALESGPRDTRLQAYRVARDAIATRIASYLKTHQSMNS